VGFNRVVVAVRNDRHEIIAGIGDGSLKERVSRLKRKKFLPNNGIPMGLESPQGKNKMGWGCNI
jgi:hypothetical protein